MITSSLGLSTLKLVGHVSHFSFVCLIVDFALLNWVGQAYSRYCVMLSRLCKACLCGNSVSKHNLEWTFNCESVSKIYLCEDCWEPNNYVKYLLCGNEVDCELLLSFFLGGFVSRYWFFWEVPRIFERWSCCGNGWFIGWGMRIAAVQTGLTLIVLNVRFFELFNIWCCSLSATSLLIFAFVFLFFVLFFVVYFAMVFHLHFVVLHEFVETVT